jgi:hypothetical protein
MGDAEMVVNVLHLKHASANQDLVGKTAKQVNQICRHNLS